MNIKQIQSQMVKHFFKLDLVSNSVGRIRYRIRNFTKIPKSLITPYIPAINTLLADIEGVTEVVLNDKIGSILLNYNPKQNTSENLQKQIEKLVDLGFSLSEELNPDEHNEEELTQLYLNKLTNVEEKSNK